jgi:hypothetical protein
MLPWLHVLGFIIWLLSRGKIRIPLAKAEELFTCNDTFFAKQKRAFQCMRRGRKNVKSSVVLSFLYKKKRVTLQKWNGISDSFSVNHQSVQWSPPWPPPPASPSVREENLTLTLHPL